MTQSDIYNVLLGYLFFVPLITLHEWAHAWVAWKCGDNTAYDEGRVTINPIAHMELVGTVVLPLMASFIALSNPTLAGFIIGWGRPVPVNISNLRRPRIDDTLVTVAGPTMNFLLAFGLVALIKVGVLTGSPALMEVGYRMAELSLVLCFFNLIPIPPLDGSHILKNLVGMSHETYMRFYQFGFIAVLIVINLPGVRGFIAWLRDVSLVFMASVFGLR
jgi:Zn-dependent protease